MGRTEGGRCRLGTWHSKGERDWVGRRGEQDNYLECERIAVQQLIQLEYSIK